MYLDVEWDYVKSTDGKDYDNQVCYDMGEAYDLVDELIEEGNVYHILVTMHETWGGVEVSSEEIYEWERNEDGSIVEKAEGGRWCCMREDCQH